MATNRSGDPMRAPVAGWLFVTPMIVILGLFLILPIVMALWVSVSNWSGRGSPFGGSTQFVGIANYSDLLTKPGLARQDFMTSLRNTFFYVIGVVPLQTALALMLAVLVNQKFLRGRTFFRTAWVGINGPNWFADPRGLIHLAGDWIGVWNINDPPSVLTGTRLVNLSLWEWIKGPSVAMSAIMLQVIWTTAGTFMLMFLAALQDLPVEVEEAARVDGANARQRFWNVTIPHLRPWPRRPLHRHLGRDVGARNRLVVAEVLGAEVLRDL